MGADLLLSWAWTTKPDGIDFEKAREIIRAEIVDSVLGKDGVFDGEFLKRWDINDSFNDDEISPADMREQLIEDTDILERLWKGEEFFRDADRITVGPVTMVITGGMSWGDSPTEFFDTLRRWGDTPAYEAAGFGT